MRERIKAGRFLLIACVVTLIAGCKLAVIVVEGGEVRSTGTGTCAAGSVCITEVSDTSFSDTFTAIPNQGWYFEKWNAGRNFLCGDSTDPSCALPLETLAGNSVVEALVASSEVFYLMPVFKMAEPVTDTITVDGKEWAQVDLFSVLSWQDIDAVCPAGVCSGVLNGFDMTGWMWATVEDLNSLFNSYIGFAALGPGSDTYAEGTNTEWAPAFFDDGWRPNNPLDEGGISQAIFGVLRDKITAPEGEVALPGAIVDAGPTAIGLGDFASTEGKVSLDLKAGGSWFYRTL